jgi:hypothetical protein
MGYDVLFQYKYTWCNVQCRINMSVSSDTYHFFMVKTFRLLSSRFLKRIVHCTIHGHLTVQ